MEMIREDAINEIYPLAALFIYGNKQEISREKMKSIFKELGVGCQEKICEFFEMMDAIKMKNLLAGSYGSSGKTAEQEPPDAVKIKASESVEKDKEKKVEEEADDDVEIDFGFF